MHEVSIALNLLDIVTKECRKNGGSTIDCISIRIGRASGIMTDALLFAFDAVKAGSVAEKARLNIEEVLVSGHCRECDDDFEVGEEYVLCCPRCGGGSFEITAGRELDIIDMEVT
jgi:hydrogenase nickel incorporation protein HypA/HybF